MNYQDFVAAAEQFFDEKDVELKDGTPQVDLSDLPEFDEEMYRYLKTGAEDGLNGLVEAYSNLHDKDVEKVEITGWTDKDLLRIADLQSVQEGQLVVIEGIVEEAEKPMFYYDSIIFECEQCGDRYRKDQEFLESDIEQPYKCDCGSRRFERHETDSRKYQEFKIKNRGEITVNLLGEELGEPFDIHRKTVKVFGVPKLPNNRENLSIVANNVVEIDRHPDLIEGKEWKGIDTTEDRFQELFVEDMKLSTQVQSVNHLEDWYDILTTLEDSFEELHRLMQGDSTSGTVTQVADQVVSSYNRVRNTFETSAKRFEKEYGMSAVEWLEEVRKDET